MHQGGSVRSRSGERDGLPEYKDVFEITEARKAKKKFHSNPVHSKNSSPEVEFVRKKFAEAKWLSTEEPLHSSREFNDTTEVLEFNRDALLEFLSTGILTPKSDIYSLGIIILRLLTGKTPLNIARQVQDALRGGIFLSVIDESAGTWPFEQAKQLAKIALRCAELSRSRRPDLVKEVWTAVEPLMKAASTYVEPQGHESELGEESVPSHYICPILQ